MILGVQDPLVLSPMVDVTDAAFRSIAKEWGADVTCSEMVSAVGLAHGRPTLWQDLAPWPGESPYGVQFMCGEPGEMQAAVETLATRQQPDFVDVNLGCPAPNILHLCAGGFLLRDPKKAGAVVGAARKACDEAGIRHVSAKLRLGPDQNRLTFIDVARECIAAGADWVTLHARTVEQGYSGTADWSKIRELVRAVDVPVVGNGDLRQPDDVVRMKEETDCAGFFIARAAMHDPTIFRRMRHALDGRDAKTEEAPDMAHRLGLALEYVRRAESMGLANVGLLRRQAMRFVAGAPGAKRLRVALQATRSVPEVKDILRAHLPEPAQESTRNSAAGRRPTSPR